MMKVNFWGIMLLVFPISAQTPLITNVYQRKATSLNGKWHYIIDPYEYGYYDYRREPFDKRENPPRDAFFMNALPRDKTERIEYNFDMAETILVPGDWNSQYEKLLYYEGTIWYRRMFDVKKQPGKRYFVHIGAANYESITYLNGKRLGSHTGGFTPFNYEIPDSLLQEKGNFLIVKVDNTRKHEAVPTIQTDWWNFGGLTRDVLLLEMNETFIQDFKLQLKKSSFSIAEGWVQLNGSRKTQKVKVEIPELKIVHEVTTNADGYASFSIDLKKPTLWDTQNPKRYDVTLSAETDKLTDKIGFRCIETKGTDILLNGKSVFLRGICIHEEVPQRKGRAYSKEDALMLLGWAKELNCNFVRLAHYTHNEYMLRVADELGLMVWAEVPVYWTIQWENPATLANAKNQLDEMITRDKNRASVVVWSVANETPVVPQRLTFLKELISLAREKDNARLISAAMEVDYAEGKNNVFPIHDPLGEYTDIISFNEYVGWYGEETPEACQKIAFDVQYDKPMFVSEFGACALYGFHGDSLTRWSEEYQESMFVNQLAMLRKHDKLRGMSPWLLADFRSPRRMTPYYHDGWNRKGLYSERGDKKKAFFILKKFYDEMENQYK